MWYNFRHETDCDRYTTDTHDFASLRNDGKIYVDKTMYMHRLVTDENAKLFFVSRPRRFGKSLTVSALKALFEGRRELFKGCYNLEWKNPDGTSGFKSIEVK